MLIDKAQITVRGGHGGVKGIKKPKTSPFGNGGHGGNVYFKASSNIDLLNQFTQQTFFASENGFSGGKNHKTGKSGKDMELLLPIGTSIIDAKNKSLIYELENEGDRILICRGGAGGFGGGENRFGLPGEEKDLILDLKLIANFGLVGLPNAGKSSLLNAITNANVKTANYPFTTLEPNLGVFRNVIIADIPGLIEKASEGKGLGIKFLKHIEKVGTILHCISAETNDISKDYETIRNELKSFDKKLCDKEEVVVITKIDLVSEDVLDNILKYTKKIRRKVIAVSIYDKKSLLNLTNLITKNY